MLSGLSGIAAVAAGARYGEHRSRDQARTGKACRKAPPRRGRGRFRVARARARSVSPPVPDTMDKLTHLYTAIVTPDNMVKILVDNVEKKSVRGARRSVRAAPRSASPMTRARMPPAGRRRC